MDGGFRDLHPNYGQHQGDSNSPLAVLHSDLDLAVISLVIFAYCLLSRRLSRTAVSGPLVFVALGLVLGPANLGWLNISLDSALLRRLAEITLGLVLFTDAAALDWTVLRNSARLPMRLLLLGLPLSILMGFVVARLILPELSLIEAALLAVVLAPTDAALGEAVTTNLEVPEAIREDLNVESGLNDGICVPMLLCFLGISTGHLDQINGPKDALQSFAQLLVSEIGLGLVIGAFVGLLGSWLRDQAEQRKWIAEDWRPLITVALALSAYTLAQTLHGSGFISCFIAGLFYGICSRKELKEGEMVASLAMGDMLALLTWVLFGSAMVPDAWSHITVASVVYGALSLTLVRVLPVALVTSGLGLDHWTKLFVGWFGPRGLASIVFVVMVVDAALPSAQAILTTTTVTIVLSVIAHGITANRFSMFYGRWERSHAG